MSTPIPPNVSTAQAPLAPPAPTPAPKTPAIEPFASHYGRYNGAIGQGENKTTHTAEVRFDAATHALAVVKAFPFDSAGWLNEAIAWTLGKEVGLAMPPRAVLLVAKPEDLKDATEPELVRAYKTMAYGKAVIFWCASRLSTKPPQQVWSRSWENVVLKGRAGQELAAFDGWIGNCDRIADNAPYWESRGLIAAIDHERLAFAQNWLLAPPVHLDREKGSTVKTYLLDRFHLAQASGVFKPKQVREVSASLEQSSKGHAPHLAACRADIAARLLNNVSAAASANLLTFLDERATEDFIAKRLGTV